MKPYFETELGTLYHGDCLEIMPQLDPVGIIITSPPYNMGISSGGGLSGAGDKGLWKKASRKNGLAKGYDNYCDNMGWDAYKKWQLYFLKTCWKNITENGAIFYNHKPRIWGGELKLPTDYNPGLTIRQIIIWRRNGGINFSPTHYLPSHEWIILFAKKHFKLKNIQCSKLSDVWDINSKPFGMHPCPYPIELPLNILQTTENNCVLDPFMGSGSTAVACEYENRRWIGIEISEKYCEIAKQRIIRERQQLKLFDPIIETSKPKQKDLFDTPNKP